MEFNRALMCTVIYQFMQGAAYNGADG